MRLTSRDFPRDFLVTPPGLQGRLLRGRRVAASMERVFRLTADLACVGEEHELPEGVLVLEPRLVGRDEFGADWVFLASFNGGMTWREYATVLEDASEWFELLAPRERP